jgi:hypothetical protein
VAGEAQKLMGYRDDLEAALERAEMLERDLKRAKAEISADEGRIAELERQLQEARASVRKHESSPDEADLKPARERRPMLMAGLIAGAAVAAGGILLLRAPTGSPPTAAPVSVPAAPPAPPVVPLPPGGVGVDPSYAVALRLAQGELGDAQLTRIEAAYVDERGVAQLGYGGEVRFRFISPSRANQPPPSAPVLGAPAVDHRLPCRMSIWFDQASKPHVGSSSRTDCTDALPPGPPHCSLAAVWQKAKVKGAPSSALATVDLRLRRSQPSWHFAIYDQAAKRTVFSEIFPDDCP